MTVTILDYGAGNVTSVGRALSALGTELRLTRSGPTLASAYAIVIPGVGHFAATASIDEATRQGLRRAIDRGVAVLGICLGMQWLFEGSAEAEDLAGLGVFAGRCAALAGDVKLPHVGWNTVEGRGPSRLLSGVGEAPWGYFSHTFAAPIGPEAVALTTYGRAFAATVERGRVFGTQWHPEKSGASGRRVLANFLELAGA